MLFGLCLLAGLVGLAVLGDVIYQIVSGADQAISTFGLGFIGHQAWAPNLGHFGAANEIYGTLVTAALAMVIATPLSVAIALYLAIIAPRSVRTIVGPLVEMLAAIPSVILGFWGIIVLAPFVQQHVEPFAARRVRLSPDLRATPDDRPLDVHRRSDPDRDGGADHRLAQPGPLPDGARAICARAPRRSARPGGR